MVVLFKLIVLPVGAGRLPGIKSGVDKLFTPPLV